MRRFDRATGIGIPVWGCALFLITALSMMSFADAMAEDTIKIGVLAKRGARKCLSMWSETGTYLSEQLARDVEIVPLKFTEVESMVDMGQVDFVLANSAFYAVLEKKFDVDAVATLINSRQGKALKEFGGVIFVKQGSQIKKLEDVKGKSMMCVKNSSFGGCHMGLRLLLNNGIDPAKDCSSFKEGQKHDNVVMAVKTGMVDVGTVRTDTIERMMSEGKVKLSDFHILHAINDGFPFVHSTALYPEWPLAACSKTSPALVAAVAKALKALPSDHPATKAAKIVGWTDPVDYGPVAECLREIKYGVFGEKRVATKD
ncbi:MAG: phosphate/phosphite/phosphonate ABC transporter substrate-binding protein [Candidatus Eisenbacteria sp.]|nr:phosphate/phosphite/phosphonate ABC transporter substrate-binding protein [Candidatus Eisenbacteria bacterium]